MWCITYYASIKVHKGIGDLISKSTLSLNQKKAQLVSQRHLEFYFLSNLIRTIIYGPYAYEMGLITRRLEVS